MDRQKDDQTISSFENSAFWVIRNRTIFLSPWHTCTASIPNTEAVHQTPLTLKDEINFCTETIIPHTYNQEWKQSQILIQLADCLSVSCSDVGINSEMYCTASQQAYPRQNHANGKVWPPCNTMLLEMCFFLAIKKKISFSQVFEHNATTFTHPLQHYKTR